MVSYYTIYIFKNYFIIVFLIFNFSKINSIQTYPKIKKKISTIYYG